MNGNWQIDLFGSSVFAGTRWSYKRETFETEQLYAAGPLTEEIIVEVDNLLSISDQCFPIETVSRLKKKIIYCLFLVARNYTFVLSPSD